ncbi:hypothetical protein HJG60_011794 [Phyllostomus discolor]|uniref:Uncharacterized protein n=1 Tax=Phyllostomus discolor TaxID=89673 RepID=A0A834DWD0_9CHIR|nr:hypothetical protein HJG60_011794 [Phyllostomus discolor]
MRLKVFKLKPLPRQACSALSLRSWAPPPTGPPSACSPRNLASPPPGPTQLSFSQFISPPIPLTPVDNSPTGPSPAPQPPSQGGGKPGLGKGWLPFWIPRQPGARVRIKTGLFRRLPLPCDCVTSGRLLNLRASAPPFAKWRHRCGHQVGEEAVVTR